MLSVLRCARKRSGGLAEGAPAGGTAADGRALK